jgi:perosamine synthetase
VNIPLSRPDIGEREIRYVVQVLRSGQLSLGPRLEEFEKKFAAYVGARYAIATNSGTSALHLCVKALGLGEGDDVLTASFSFVASTNSILYERANPVFVDIDASTFNLDPSEIRRTIAGQYAPNRSKSRLVNRRSGRALKAILPVHVFGLPCDLASILDIAREYNLHVIEDACEAIGARYDGRHVGTFGDAAAFAFYPNKQMTTAEGGMIVTNDSRIAALCRSLRNQGRDETCGWLRHTALGYNYRLSDVHCALGLAQLERIEELLAARARVAASYARELGGVPQVALPSEASQRGIRRSWFAYVIQIHGQLEGRVRDHLMTRLRERGIACQAYFPPIHRQPYFEQREPKLRYDLPTTEEVSKRCLALPFFPSMTDAQVSEVCAAIREILAEAKASREMTRNLHREAAPAAD